MSCNFQTIFLVGFNPVAKTQTHTRLTVGNNMGMTRASAFLLFLCCFATLPSAFGQAGGSSASGPALGPGQDEPLRVQEEIRRVQNGLLPAAFIKGEAIRRMKLSDRMFVYQVTGVSIAVIHNGSVDWAKGFGVLSLGGPPITADTLFQAASVSKPVTALAALRLVQSGKIELDTDINGHLRSWKLPSNNFTDRQKVTLHELLTHTAGTTVQAFPGYASTEPIPTLRQVLDGIPPANTPPIRVDTPPGTHWRYSGGGYTIVQQALVDVTGRAFPELMQENVLRPLGMTRSTFDQPLPRELTANASTPYLGTGEEVKGGSHTYPEMAAAGLWTTAQDLARFAIAVQNSLAGRPGAVLSRQLAEQMVESNVGKRGIMFGVGGSDGDPYFAHSGEDAGFVSYLVAYEKKGDGAVVMTNGDRGFDLTEEIMRAIAHEYGWPDFYPVEHTLATVDSQRLDQYAGCYQLSPGIMVTVTHQTDHLSVQVSGQDPWQMLPDSETHFFSKSVDVQLAFPILRDGSAPELVLRQYGEDSVAKKIH